MTYCLGIKIESALIAIADTRLTSGTETTIGRKLSVSQKDDGSLFIMTSGLRSVRDKAITYFDEVLSQDRFNFSKMYQAVNAFAQQLRQVKIEDEQALTDAGYKFNLNAIVGGQLSQDNEHKLFRLYGEGNWVEIGMGSPFVIIGNSGYGKPILDRVLRYQSSINMALKAGFLSFDSTYISANDVGYPLDFLVYPKNSFQMVTHRFHENDLEETSGNWKKALIAAIRSTPDDWTQIMLDKVSDLPKTESMDLSEEGL